MKLKYLGTGAAEGMPATFCACPVCRRSMAEGGKSLRMRSCTLIDDRIMIDLGPDFHAQKLRFGVDAARLKAVVFTHSHEDHEDLYTLQSYGTPSCTVRPGVPEKDICLHLYGNEWVHRRFYQALAQGLRMQPERFCFHEVSAWEQFRVEGYTFHALRANHRPIVIEDCLIYAISDGCSAILYANDTGELSPDADAYLQKTGLVFSIVSMDCARGLLPGDGHMGWQEVLRLKERLLAIGAANDKTRFVLNHLSHMNDMTHSEWEAFAAPYGIEVAWDGLELEC